MPWVHYLASFFAGALLANVVPHFVKGICGDPFPTPFAKPPGKGLSSPLVNVLWALANLVAGYFVLRAGQISKEDVPAAAAFFAGIALISLSCSQNFARKHSR